MNDDSAVSLSFLDVITNSLGSVLLLFFIMVALKETALLLDQPPSTKALQHVGQGEDRQPFVLLISVPSGQSLLSDLKANPWDREGTAPTFGTVAWGSNYAVFYADGAPPADAKLFVGPLEPNVRFRVQEFRAGKRRAPREEMTAAQLSRDAKGRTRIWPLPKTGEKP
jgi:hypothetical protein